MFKFRNFALFTFVIAHLPFAEVAQAQPYNWGNFVDEGVAHRQFSVLPDQEGAITVEKARGGIRKYRVRSSTLSFLSVSFDPDTLATYVLNEVGFGEISRHFEPGMNCLARNYWGQYVIDSLFGGVVGGVAYSAPASSWIAQFYPRLEGGCIQFSGYMDPGKLYEFGYESTGTISKNTRMKFKNYNDRLRDIFPDEPSRAYISKISFGEKFRVDGSLHGSAPDRVFGDEDIFAIDVDFTGQIPVVFHSESAPIRLTITEVETGAEIANEVGSSGEIVSFTIDVDEDKHYLFHLDWAPSHPLNLFVNQDYTILFQGSVNTEPVSKSPHGNRGQTPPNTPPSNGAPVAKILPANDIELGQSVAFDASASSDPDGDALTFEWRITQPNGGVLVPPASAVDKFEFTPSEIGSYVAQLIVDDGELRSAQVTQTLSVFPVPLEGHDVRLNQLAGVPASIDENERICLELTASNIGEFEKGVRASYSITGPNYFAEGETHLGSIPPGVNKVYPSALCHQFPSGIVEGAYSISAVLIADGGDIDTSNNSLSRVTYFGEERTQITQAYHYLRVGIRGFEYEAMDLKRLCGNSMESNRGIGWFDYYAESGLTYHYTFDTQGVPCVQLPTGAYEAKSHYSPGEMYAFDGGKLLVGIDSANSSKGKIAAVLGEPTTFTNHVPFSALVGQEYTFDITITDSDAKEVRGPWKYDIDDAKERFSINSPANGLNVQSRESRNVFHLRFSADQPGKYEFVIDLEVRSDDPCNVDGTLCFERGYFWANTFTVFAPPADTDGDGVEDALDSFPNDPAASIDSDGDGAPDFWNSGYRAADSTTGLVLDFAPQDPMLRFDSDGDGVADKLDAFPNDPSVHADADGDGWGNKVDAFPLDPAAYIDSDGDGYPDSWNPHVLHENSALALDRFPNDPTEWFDGDGDGSGDNSDAFRWNRYASVDEDRDGYPDAWNGRYTEDPSGELSLDLFPSDPSEWSDSDGDGIGDNSDAFPYTAQFKFDSDADGVADLIDFAPLDALEWLDSDGDGQGDNADNDDDNDLMPDAYERHYGFNPNAPDDAHLDADNDGLTNLDEFNLGTLPNEEDTDGDGILDGADNLPLVSQLDVYTLDIDGSGEVDFRDALITLYVELGLRNQALYDAVTSAQSSRRLYGELLDYMNNAPIEMLDINGDGSITPVNDGLAFLYFVIGIHGEKLAEIVNVEGVDSNSVRGYLHERISKYVQ